MRRPFLRGAMLVLTTVGTAVAQPPPPPDTPPGSMPNDKAQCYNGHWRDFKVFKNQGDCVSYVATKGKNPPALTVTPPPPPPPPLVPPK